MVLSTPSKTFSIIGVENPRLSILIATIGRRNDKLIELLNALVPQTEKWEIEVVAYWNCGELKIGPIRQALLEEAQGEYVCFIDDDDKVPAYYCDKIMYALGKDYVGFEVELFNNNNKMPRVFHSIKYGIWHQDDQGYYRGVTHLNPLRRELALLGNFGPTGIGEDETWARTVTPHVRTENYVNLIMYYYLHDSSETMFGGDDRKPQKYKRPEFEHPKFRWHPNSKKEGEM